MGRWFDEWCMHTTQMIEGRSTNVGMNGEVDIDRETKRSKWDGGVLGTCVQLQD